MAEQFPKEKLQCVLNEVWESPHSDFYRNIWRKNGITTRPVLIEKSDWGKIPFLTRTLLEEYPNPSDRLYVPIEDVESLRATSGTSKRAPLYIWRNQSHYIDGIHAWYYGAGSRRMMTFFPQNIRNAIDAQRAGLELLYGDSRNLDYSAELITQVNVDTIIAPATLILVLADYLEKTHYLEKIRLIILTGEYCSDAMFATLKKRLPQAKFFMRYALAEANGTIANGTVMYASDNCTNKNRIAHIRPDFFFAEIVDGELTLTSLRISHAMPLIRYQTGDAARQVDEPCPCGSIDLRYELMGRIHGDSLRIGGGELRIEELERVITPFYAYIEPLFKVEVSERHAEGRRTVHLAFLIKKRAGCELPEDLIQHNITTSLLRDLHLSPTMRLGDAVAAQLFLQPQVVFVESLPVDLKNPRIVMQKKELPN